MNMSWTRKVAGGTGVAAALTASLALAGPAAGAGAAGARVVSAGVAALPAQVRVNQVGYTTDGSKEAFAMLPVAAGPRLVHRVRRPPRGLPRHVNPERGTLERELPGHVRAGVRRADQARDLPDHG